MTSPQYPPNDPQAQIARAEKEKALRLLQEFVNQAGTLQAEINAAGMGDPRDAELALLRAWKTEAEIFMANSLEMWDAQNAENERLERESRLLKQAVMVEQAESTRLREFRTKVAEVISRFNSAEVSPTPDQREVVEPIWLLLKKYP